MNDYFEGIVGALGFRTGGCNCFVGGENNRHAAMSFHLGFTEDADLYARFAEHSLQVVEFNLIGVTLNNNCTRGGAAEETDFGNRQTQKSARMQSKFTELLRNHSHHTGVVGTR